MVLIERKDIEDKIFELYQSNMELVHAGSESFPVFDEPSVRIADAADPVIENLKNVIGPFHWGPGEALGKAFPEADTPLQASSVISWCLPVSEAARKANRKADYYPSREWAWTRTFGERLNDRIREGLGLWLTDSGWPSFAPALHPDFGFIEESPVGIASPWSERHYAWAAGHGTFGISGGLITERGIAHRLGSVVSSLPLRSDVREYGSDPFAWCLKTARGTCGVCMKRCPVNSIGRDHSERNKELCNEHDMKRIAAQYGKLYDWEGIYGCGLCQTAVPCEFKRPV